MLGAAKGALEEQQLSRAQHSKHAETDHAFPANYFACSDALVVAASSASAQTVPNLVASVPGPIAGAGLGYLVLAGGYYLVRRWRKPKSGE